MLKPRINDLQSYPDPQPPGITILSGKKPSITPKPKVVSINQAPPPDAPNSPRNRKGHACDPARGRDHEVLPRDRLDARPCHLPIDVSRRPARLRDWSPRTDRLMVSRLKRRRHDSEFKARKAAAAGHEPRLQFSTCMLVPVEAYFEWTNTCPLGVAFFWVFGVTGSMRVQLGQPTALDCRVSIRPAPARNEDLRTFARRL